MVDEYYTETGTNFASFFEKSFQVDSAAMRRHLGKTEPGQSHSFA